MNTPLREFVIACLFVSCSCRGEAPAKPPKETEVAQSPAPSAEIAPPPAPPAVPAQWQVSPPPLVAQAKLEAQIPKSVGEWSRIELRFHVQKTGDGDVEQADGVYKLDDKHPLIHVSLLDTRGFTAIHGSFNEMHDRPTYGITPFEQQGQPSLEQFLPKPLNTVLMTLVEKRFLILISGEGSDQATVKQFLDAMNVKAIAALK